MKGEEGVCHVTEADTPGAAALDVSEEVSSCEAAVRLWAPACAGARPPANAGDGFCPCARRCERRFPEGKRR